MKVKIVLVAVITLIAGVAVAYAETNADLKSGVYKTSGIQGAANVVIKAGGASARKQVTVHAADGSVAMRGSARITGTRVNVDYGDDGYETWTIIDEETFTDDNYNLTWRWVRRYTNDDL
jgi:hypothetical protein